MEVIRVGRVKCGLKFPGIKCLKIGVETRQNKRLKILQLKWELISSTNFNIPYIMAIFDNPHFHSQFYAPLYTNTFNSGFHKLVTF